MDWDDVQPKSGNKVVVGANLERLSVDELAARIVQLSDEIERVEAELKRKRDHELRAAGLFKR
ncbi:MAG TPA: DUF1192 domain-containing protein [Hyphomicrobiaceae bacterium]|nr:DUF1192 domain-containing protein [Hyphomicrobiaceae bacterium]